MKSQFACASKTNPERLLSYVAGRLGAVERREIEAHAADCARCQEFLAKQAAVWALLDRFEAVPVSANFDIRLKNRIVAEQESAWWTRTWRWMSTWEMPHGLRPAAALSLAGALAVGVFLYRPAVPAPGPAAGTMESAAAVENPDVELLEQTLEDLELLQSASL